MPMRFDYRTGRFKKVKQGRFSKIQLVLLFAIVVGPGCRSDAASSSPLAPFSPARWFAKKATSATDEFELQPIPEGGYDAPPLPPPGRVVLPPPPPVPEPADDGSARSFYGVRPTSAEQTGPPEPAWMGRVRHLFRRGQSRDELPTLRPVPETAVAAPIQTLSATNELAPYLPSGSLPSELPRPLIVLGQPEFESRTMDRSSGTPCESPFTAPHEVHSTDWLHWQPAIVPAAPLRREAASPENGRSRASIGACETRR
jgi:hypothetical protein